MPDGKPAGLLSGIRVLDLTNVLAGPYCAYQLALLGADVIKVEQPGGGDLARQLGASPELNKAGMGASFLAQNAGKRSVVARPEEGGRPRTVPRSGRDRRCAGREFPAGRDGAAGPRLRDAAGKSGRAWSIAPSPASARPGRCATTRPTTRSSRACPAIMSITGTPETAPLRVGYPVCDTLGGLAGAFAIVSALLRRRHPAKARSSTCRCSNARCRRSAGRSRTS